MKRRFFLPLVLVITGCKKDPPPVPAVAEAVTVDAGVDAAPLVVKPLEMKSGADLKAFFPPDGALGTKRTFTQEKPGFAEAKVQQGGKDLAVLSITDALNDAGAKGKFANVPDKVGGAPYLSSGKTQSSTLVKNRYVLTIDSPSFDEKRRKIWLAHFNVNGL
ncbi:MAG: hypothetical protein ABIP39_14950 [Polyangiaceae bacterium]